MRQPTRDAFLAISVPTHRFACGQFRFKPLVTYWARVVARKVVGHFCGALKVDDALVLKDVQVALQRVEAVAAGRVDVQRQQLLF